MTRMRLTRAAPTRTRTSKVPPAHTATTSGRRLAYRGFCAVLVLCTGCLPVAHASHKDKHSKQAVAVRIVAQGKVVNHAKAPVSGAVVYLEDPKSLAIKSYLTDASGQFHFAQLSPQTDYEVWAEQNGIQSKHKFISQFSSHVHFNFILKLDPKQKKLLGFL